MKKAVAKRKYLRLEDVNFPVEYKVKDSNSEKYKKAIGKTIGEGGLYLISEADFPAGIKLELKIQIPRTFLPSPQVMTIRAEGEVVWVRPDNSQDEKKYCYGISFTKIALKDFAPLRNYILLARWMRDSLTA